MNNFEITRQNIESYLTDKSNHNTVGINHDCSSYTGFICELLGEGQRFWLKILIDPDIEAAIFDVCPGIRVPEPYRAMTAKRLAEISAKHKGPKLCLSSYGDICAEIQTSFHDAPLSGHIAELYENLCLLSLILYSDEIDMIAHGIIPASGKSDEKLSEIVEQIKGLASSLIDPGNDTPFDLEDFLKNLPDFDEE